jgi:hypothetical protein
VSNLVGQNLDMILVFTTLLMNLPDENTLPLTAEWQSDMSGTDSSLCMSHMEVADKLEGRGLKSYHRKPGSPMPLTSDLIMASHTKEIIFIACSPLS